MDDIPEKNFTMIPNELLEALARTKLSAYESKYIFALLRKTFGFRKKLDYIANSQFAKITGIRRPHICRTEIMLLGRKIITCKGNKVGLNASFDQWQELPTEVIITRRGKVITHKGNKKLPARVATKESKENIQKKEGVQNSSNDLKELSDFLITKNKLRRLDGSPKENMKYGELCIKTFGLEEAKKAIEAAAANKFHSQNSTKFKYLYEHFEAIMKLPPKVKKRFYKGDPMVYSETKRKWYVISKTGEWLLFAGKESEIEQRD